MWETDAATLTNAAALWVRRQPVAKDLRFVLAVSFVAVVTASAWQLITSAGYDERALAIFMDNLRRYRAGQPLRNIVDKRLGY